MPDINFYFDTIKKILDQTIPSYSTREGKPTALVDLRIAKHIKNTSDQHKNPDPNIDYDEPLCRLGYLFKHAGANATLFEKTISRSQTLKKLCSINATNCINIITVGGGPGTELLGLTKYLILNKLSFSEIQFTVLDRVSEWAETWNHIAKECQNAFIENSDDPPVIHKSFHTMNVVEASSYRSYGWLFGDAQLIVFNYLLSENIVSLPDFAGALQEMVQRATSGCYFVVIDRLEYKTPFRQDVEIIFSNSGLTIHDNFPIGTENADWTVSDKEEAFGDYLKRFKSRPRRWFCTEQPYRYPTVFAMIAQKI